MNNDRSNSCKEELRCGGVGWKMQGLVIFARKLLLLHKQILQEPRRFLEGLINVEQSHVWLVCVTGSEDV